MNKPSDLMCSNYEDAPHEVKQATAGRHSVLLYFKGN
jgi:hypothetical protein